MTKSRASKFLETVSKINAAYEPPKYWSDLKAGLDAVQHALGQVNSDEMIPHGSHPSVADAMKAHHVEMMGHATNLQECYDKMSEVAGMPTTTGTAKRHAGDELTGATDGKGDEVGEKKLTYQQRKALPDSDFAYPHSRKYPADTKARARNALARVAQDGTPAEQKAVRAFVKKKYPDIK